MTVSISSARFSRSPLRALSALLVSTLFLALPQQSVQAAGPRVMIVDGEPLTAPIRIDLWEEGFGVLAGAEYQGDRSDLDDRSYLRLGFFWGPDWSAYLDSGGSLLELQPEQANWHGRLYPASADREPVIYATGYGYRLLSPEIVSRLERHGVPVRLDPETRENNPGDGTAIWWFVGLTTILLAGSAYVALRRRPARIARPNAAPGRW